jgi:hypothetical protein
MRITICTRIFVAPFIVVMLMVMVGTNAFISLHNFFQNIKNIESG